MRKTIVLSLLSALPIVVAACAQKAESVKPDAEKQPSAQAARPEAKPEPASELSRQIDALIPRMASDDVAVREEAQKTFEMMCLTAARPGAEQERIEVCGEILRRLGPQTPPRARVWMIHQLERVGRDECVERLAELLGDEDALIRETARRALQHNPSADVRAVLVKALEKADTPEWQIALINALAARREADSVGVLCAWAKRPERDVAAAAMAALGDLGDAQAIQTLYALWREDDPTVQNRAAAALVRLAEQLGAAGDRELATRIFDDLYTYGDSEPTRLAGLRGSTLGKGPAAVVPLLEIMRDGEPPLALRAARLAVEIPGEAVTLTLAMMMAEMPSAVQAALLEGLGQRGDATARAAVINGAQSSDEAVRIAALRALRELGNSSDVMLLAHIAATSAGAERDAARSSLDRLHGDDIDATILQGAQGQAGAPVRCELIRALAARWYYPAIPALLAASADSDEDVQVAAFEALSGLGLPAHLPELIVRLVEEMGDRPREAAENATVSIAARIEDAEHRADAVLDALADTRGVIRASLIRVLGRIGGSRALEAIRGEWRDSDADVADAAVRALANWPTTDVIDDLLEIARVSVNDTHRVLALRGYVRLVRLPSDRTPAETFQKLEAAMALASRPDEKKLVLGALAEVRHIDALMMADMCLGDEALRDEAAVTMLAIARALAAEQRDAALAAIEKVSKTATSEKVHQQAADAAAFVERFAGYSAAWLAAGPYSREGQDAAGVFETAFPPESSEAAGVEWKPLAINNRDNPWIFLLEQAIGGSNCCVYVKTDVWSDTQQNALLAIGSDDAVKVWLNGKLVHSNLVYRGVAPGQDKVEVTLREGWNPLMLKVVQGNGAWGFCAGFTAPDGTGVHGLKFRAQ
jgi:HEAT repeat protein